MIVQWFRAILLLAFVSLSVGCALLEPPKDKKETRETRRRAQTGSNIPRSTPASAKAAKSEKKAKPPKAKATPTPKPKRERAKPAGKVDKDFVTRGGFR
jgi:cytochrome c biogenesis protein ResB